MTNILFTETAFVFSCRTDISSVFFQAETGHKKTFLVLHPDYERFTCSSVRDGGVSRYAKYYSLAYLSRKREQLDENANKYGKKLMTI